MVTTALTRRALLQTAATTALAAPFVHGAHAAGKLSVGFWDHWVPGANDTLTKLCNEWAAKEKVEVQIDFITSQGNKLLLTGAAESQARTGHDVLALSTWLPARVPEKTRSLERWTSRASCRRTRPARTMLLLTLTV